MNSVSTVPTYSTAVSGISPDLNMIFNKCTPWALSGAFGNNSEDFSELSSARVKLKANDAWKNSVHFFDKYVLLFEYKPYIHQNQAHEWN